MNPIGVHFIPTHQGRQHSQFIRDMQPGILKLVGSSTPDVQQIADGYKAAPNSLIYLRNVARSEQHDFLWRDPVGAAVQHVKEWHADLSERSQQAHDRGLDMPSVEQFRILGINEPVIELFARNEDMSNYGEWLAMVTARAALLDSYMETFGLEANRLGYGAGLGNISSGQPANKKPGEYATFDWFPKTRKLLEATRGLNAYACHEYWRAETGPEGHADWHAWRFTHLNVDGDIDVLECGVDQQITTEDAHGNRGWVGHMDANAYVDQHYRYIERARQDSRFRCETPFTLDGDKMWESFWIEYCMPEMIRLSSWLRNNAPSTPDTKPVDIHLPSVPNEQPQPQQPATVPALAHPIRDPARRVISQRFGDNPAEYARFGLAGHSGIDFAVAVGTVVVAVDAGQVMEAGELPDYGTYIKLRHVWGESIYAHLSELRVTHGEHVGKGEMIAFSGNTGNSTGPHLHYAMRVYPYQRGAPFDGFSDPAPYLINVPAQPSQPTPASDKKEMVKAIALAALEFDIDSDLLLSQAWAESSFNPSAVSSEGAKGLLQIMPKTWAEWSPQVGAGSDPFDPQQNARVGARYLKEMLKLTGNNPYQALIAYGWGPGNWQSDKPRPDAWVAYANKIVHGRDLLKAVGA